MAWVLACCPALHAASDLAVQSHTCIFCLFVHTPDILRAVLRGLPLAQTVDTLAKQNAEKGVGSMQGWEEVDGTALQVCAACNLAWLDTTFQLAPEAGLESGNRLEYSHSICQSKDIQACLCCSLWEILFALASEMPILQDSCI